MSADAIIVILIGMVAALVGILYGLLRAEDKRLARNIHSLRNLAQSVIMTLAARGIKVPRKDDSD